MSGMIISLSLHFAFIICDSEYLNLKATVIAIKLIRIIYDFSTNISLNQIVSRLMRLLVVRINRLLLVKDVTVVTAGVLTREVRVEVDSVRVLH